MCFFQNLDFGGGGGVGGYIGILVIPMYEY